MLHTLRAASLMRDIPDFPEPGIVFKDITPVLADADAFNEVLDQTTVAAREMGAEGIIGIESRGFIFGAPVANRLHTGFIPVRKPGKLPHSTIAVDYSLEYGKNILEIHTDALFHGQKVVIIDDVLATGGTAAASAELVEQLGGVVAGYVFIVELSFLKGREKLDKYPVRSLIIY
jgi:adenine phosphoribosyltransferase